MKWTPLRPLMIWGTTVTPGSGVGQRVSFPCLIYDTRHNRHFKCWLILDDSQAFAKSKLRLKYNLPLCVMSFAPQKILSSWTNSVTVKEHHASRQALWSGWDTGGSSSNWLDHKSSPPLPYQVQSSFPCKLLWKNTMHQGKHCDQVEMQVDQAVTLMVSDQQKASTVTQHCGIIPSRSAAPSELWPLNA